ncbi:hypothetical protein LEP1GSC073_1488 [Leptospira noguchii str. Cascata]|nr:hypothetical protein LEP1GSC072_0219 [Leptospira noguchii str. Bonito]EMS88484.1 hypothetical protein LEP1GSC073_1488 [Leptospira noguchii str. Cascata]
MKEIAIFKNSRSDLLQTFGKIILAIGKVLYYFIAPVGWYSVFTSEIKRVF